LPTLEIGLRMTANRAVIAPVFALRTPCPLAALAHFPKHV
jgi:hypothetical protein